jgi:hypothetical protein
MRKLFLFAAMTFGLTAFSQGESTFNYKAKFEGVHDATKAAPILTAMKTVFKTAATYNEGTEMVEFTSKMSISKTVFNNMMSGEGFPVESFDRQEVKAEVAPPVQKVAVDTSSKTTATTTAVKKDSPKTGTTKKTPPKPPK